MLAGGAGWVLGGAVAGGVVGFVGGFVVGVAFGWVAAGGWVVDGALVVGGPGAMAPVGRHRFLPGSSMVLAVALLAASSDFIVTLARLAIEDHESPDTTVYIAEQALSAARDAVAGVAWVVVVFGATFFFTGAGVVGGSVGAGVTTTASVGAGVGATTAATSSVVGADVEGAAVAWVGAGAGSWPTITVWAPWISAERTIDGLPRRLRPTGTSTSRAPIIRLVRTSTGLRGRGSSEMRRARSTCTTGTIRVAGSDRVSVCARVPACVRLNGRVGSSSQNPYGSSELSCCMRGDDLSGARKGPVKVSARSVLSSAVVTQLQHWGRLVPTPEKCYGPVDQPPARHGGEGGI